MHLKNIGARLVLINTAKPKAGAYQVIPAADAVDIPDEGINKHVKAYIDGLIDSGELVEVSAPKGGEPAKRGRKPKDESTDTEE